MNDSILQLLPNKRLNVIVHDAHFMGGEASTQRWSLVLPIYQLCRTPTNLLQVLDACVTEEHPKLLQWSEQALVYLLPPGDGLYWNDERQRYRHKLSFKISTGRKKKKCRHKSLQCPYHGNISFRNLADAFENTAMSYK